MGVQHLLCVSEDKANQGLQAALTRKQIYRCKAKDHQMKFLDQLADQYADKHNYTPKAALRSLKL